jgi:hypothetical protein
MFHRGLYYELFAPTGLLFGNNAIGIQIPRRQAGVKRCPLAGFVHYIGIRCIHTKTSLVFRNSAVVAPAVSASLLGSSMPFEVREVFHSMGATEKIISWRLR